MKKYLFITLLVLSFASSCMAQTNSVQTICVEIVGGGGCLGGSDGYIGFATYNNTIANGSVNQIFYEYYTPTEGGTITYAHGYKFSNSGTYQIGVWSQSGTLLTSTGAQSGGDNPIEAVHSSVDSYCLISGVTYIVGYWRFAAWNDPGGSVWTSGPVWYNQTMATFGDFTPADTGGSANAHLVITLNNSASSF